MRLAPHARAALAFIAILTPAACNAVLDNRPGTLDESNGTEASRASGGAAADGGVPSGQAVANGDPASGHDAPDGGRPPTDPNAPPDATTVGCAPGFGDCNGAAGDGCESNLMTTITSCGACGVVCPAAGPPNTFATCNAGTCVRSCAPGFSDCNGKPADGCEVDLMTDKRNCGACKNHCLFGHCANGTCVANF
jgi:hypothetical protein